MNKKKRIFVPDGNWYIWRAWHTLRTSRPIEEALPFHLLSMFCKDAAAVRADYMLIAFDGPKVFRYKFFPEYKSGRDKNKEKNGPASDEQFTAMQGSPYDYLPNVYSLFGNANLSYFQPRIFEADDVLCSIANAYCDEYDIVIGAQDKDCYQYLKPGIRAYDSSHKGKDKKPQPIYRTHETPLKQFGVRADQMIQYQILAGDKLDAIPRIGDLTPLKASKILQEYDNLARWYKESKKDRPFLDSQRENIKRNRKLVTLRLDALPPTEPSEWKPPKTKSDIHSALPKSFHLWFDQLYPKSRGLFG
jgi:5'-3' exonuclease